MLVYLLASATDVLDGYLARKWNQITSFGKLMDPLADKLMMLTMVFCLVKSGYLPLWVLIALFAKETFMVVGSGLLLKGVGGRKKVVVASNWAGKAATAALLLAIVMIFPWHPWEALRSAGRIMMYAAVGFSLYAMVNYTLIYVKKTADKKLD